MTSLKKIERKIIWFTFCGALAIFTMGCSEDSPLDPSGNCFGGNWAQQYSDELQAYSNAISAYNENPTASNCTSYKNAAKNYLDALRDVYECVPTASRADIDDAINEAKAEVDSEDCD